MNMAGFQNIGTFQIWSDQQHITHNEIGKIKILFSPYKTLFELAARLTLCVTLPTQCVVVEGMHVFPT